MHEIPKICKACGGKCCKGLPGHAAPEDFGTTKEAQIEGVKKALHAGNWQIDWWEGVAELPVSKKRVDKPYLIRPKALDGRNSLFNPTFGGTCVFLGAAGCTLTAEQRPYECRLLVPSPDFECNYAYESKLTVAELWLDADIDLAVLGNEVLAESGRIM